MNKVFYTICFFVVSNQIFSQTQLGSDIDGDAGDALGYGLALSSNGQVIATGSDPGAGYVKVFEYSPTGVTSWTQLGSDLNGQRANDTFSKVSLSGDGTILAVGAIRSEGVNNNKNKIGQVKVFKYDGSNWVQLGQSIDGENANDFSGSVSLSEDGETLAIGATQNDGGGSNSGHVRVYRYVSSSSTWTKIGSDINGDGSNDFFGTSISLSNNGNILAIGACQAGSTNYGGNYVKILEYSSSSDSWSQLGSTINGDNSDDRFGVSVSINGDGDVLAVGSEKDDGNGTDSGQVKVYSFTPTGTSSWSLLGSAINGEAAGDQFGTSVSISDNGLKIIASARFNQAKGTETGHARVFKYFNNSWIQIGSDIDGEAADDQFGYRAVISGNGNIVAGSGRDNDGNGTNSGHVRVYAINSPPTNISLSSTTVNENVSIGTTVGGLTSTDSDSGDSHSYSLVSGSGDTDNSSFSISGSNLLTATSLDYETKNSYSIVIQTSDGTATYSKTFTLSVTDIFEDDDGDGIANHLDNAPNTSNADQADADGDGVGDVVDNAPNTANANQADTDGDGQGDVIDTDDDNDGVPDSQDAFPTDASESLDTDGDGVGDNADVDADSDGIIDISDNCILTSNIDQADLDGDGIGDACDPDTDGDGYTYYNEASCGTSDTDASSIPLDNDGDFIADCVDDDDDNDGYKDTNDIFPFDASEWADNDADGTGDNADTDDDNDGWLDTIEQTCGTDPNDSSDTPIDSDNDGEPNCIDTDDDNDTYLDTEDAFPLDPLEWADNDLDSIGDNADTDDDNDEYLDVDEIACQSDPLDSSSLPLDYDGDLSPDCIDDNDDNDYCLDVDDDFPLNKDLCVDSDGDGIDNRFELDADDDGIPDYRDDFPFDATESKDTDGDGIGDNVDQDDNNDGFSDEGTIVSTALTPNQPGIESTWKIINIEKYPFTSVKVYSPDGSEVYKSTNYQNDWSGNNIRTGSPLPTGPYYYRIALGGNSNEIKEGWLYIFN